MGARQSYLYIYLKNKDKKYQEDDYSVTPFIQSVDNCKNFEVVTHKIDYTKANDTYFDIYLYETEDKNPNAYYFFAYCSPGIVSHVARSVHVYYSILGPNIPLVVSFERNKDTINCDIDKLRRDRWNWAAYMTDYSLGKDMTKNLEEAFKKAFRNRTMEFVIGDGSTKDVLVYPQKIDDKKYRLIFIPNADDSVFNFSCLFTFNTTRIPGYQSTQFQVGCKEPSHNGANNQIDSYYLDSLKKVGYFNGIIIYFAREKERKDDLLNEEHDKNTALIVEFVNLCTTISFKRKNKNCSWWAEEPFNYKNYNDLPGELDTIDKAAKDEVNAVIIEKTSSYHGVSLFKEDKQQAYMKYTHEFGTANTTVLLSNRTKLDVGPFKDLNIKAKHVDVCYLKAGDTNDTQPFLIALYENDDAKLSKVCHFNNKDEFKDWEELKPVEKLEDKLKKISESGSCSTHVFWLRKVAFYILTTDQPPPDPPPEEAVPPERPPVDSPTPPPPPGRNWWLIIGCSVGAFLLIVALAIGYAIYWYNTTIRLLT